MNRRGFIRGLAGALAGFSILPAATTYTRLWKAVKTDLSIPNPAYATAQYECIIAVPIWKSDKSSWDWVPVSVNEEMYNLFQPRA